MCLWYTARNDSDSELPNIGIKEIICIAAFFEIFFLLKEVAGIPLPGNNNNKNPPNPTHCTQSVKIDVIRATSSN